MNVRKSQGFTLIELLIVIALIAVLAGAVIIALNPARQFQQARDSQRWSHVSAIAGAITGNITENKGLWTCPGVPLPTTSTAITSAAGGTNICSCLVPSQMATIPVDPSGGAFTFTSCASFNSGYSLIKDSVTGRITVTSTSEIATTTIISVTQ